MHIPSAPTAELEIAEFDRALAESGRCGGYDTDRWLYVPDRYTEYRYILATRGENPLICIGVNPSTAAPGELDNTLKSVERIALSNGYDSFIMLNVYAQRATRPGDMDLQLNTAMHRENLRAFEYAVSLCRGEKAVWAAWGNVIGTRKYLFGCVEDMARVGSRCGVKWYTAGRRSNSGNPHHPLYLKKDSVLEEFDIEEYIRNMKMR